MIPYATVNDGYRYILNLIDLFSRYAWAEPLIDKTGVEVTAPPSDLCLLRDASLSDCRRTTGQSLTPEWYSTS